MGISSVVGNLPKSRAAALADGSKLFFNGIPCLRGHIAPRITARGTCTECVSLKRPVYQSVYKANNPGAVSASNKKWSKANRAKIAANVRARQAGLRRATPAWVDRNALEAFYVEAQRLTEITGIKHSVDHIYPLSGDNFCGLHVPWNLRVMQLIPNIIKGTNIPGDIDIRSDGTIEVLSYRERRRRRSEGDLCKHGHLLSADNICINSKGRLECRVCQRLASKRYAKRSGYRAQAKYKARLRSAVPAGQEQLPV